MRGTEEPNRSDTEIDIGALLGALFRSLPVVILLAGAVGVGVFFYLSTLSPKYRAEARVLIESGESRLTRPQGVESADGALLDEGGVLSQVQLIRSRDLARKVARELDLASRSEFNPTLGSGSLLDEFLATLGVKDSTVDSSEEERILNAYFARLEVYPIQKSRVIAIEFTSTDPDLAARAANQIADEYLELQRVAKREDTEDAASFLSGEIETLRKRVADAELEVAKFRAGSDLFSGGQNNATLAQQQLIDFNAELSRVRAARADAEAKAAQIRAALKSGAALESTDVLNSPLIQRMRERQVALRARIAELSATLLPAHPRMIELKAQLADEEAQIRREAEKIVRGLENDTKLAEARETEIQKEMGQLKAAAARSDTDEVQLRALQREATAQRELLETYLRSYRDAAARQSGDYQPADARIISQASAPAEPFFPKVIPMSLFAAVAAALGLMVVVLIRELASGRPLRRVAYDGPLPAEPDAIPVDGHLRWPEGGSVRRVLPVGAVAPANNTEAVEHSLSTIARRIVSAGAHRVLVMRVGDFGDAAGGRPLAAVALARSVSRLAGSVVLIDLVRDDVTDLAMLEQENLPGLTDIYAGTASFAQAIFRDRSSAAHFIPAGQNEPGDDLSPERLRSIFDALAHTYDHVIFDAAEGMVEFLAPDCEAAMLVSEAGAADPRTVRAYEQLADAGAGEVMLLVVDPAREGETAAGAAA